MNNQKTIRIVVTGGPGGGKTTALDLFQREFKSQVSVVPEAATLLFENGVRPETDPSRIKLLQQGIYKVQNTLEETFSIIYPERLLVCDRGTLDGLAYWPESEADFFKTLNTTLEAEIKRYDAIIFFQSSAATGEDIKSNNPYRSESAVRATELDERLREVWSRHPHFHYVPNNSSFMKKIDQGLKTINSVLQDFGVIKS